MILYFVAADFTGSSWYRIIQPAGLCKEIYDDSMWSLPERLNVSHVKKSDMIVIQRQCHEVAYETTKELLKLDKIIVSEIDDNLWSIPPDTANMFKFWTREKIKGFENILKISHAVTVSTPRLAKMVKEFNSRVYVLPNLVVFDRSYKKYESPKIRIGWTGSESHMPDFTLDVQDALLDIKEKYKEKVDIFTFGIVPPKLFSKVTYYQFAPPHLYLAFLQKLGMDIGIIPNRNNLFNDCRSNLKFSEYSSVGAVTIASNTESFKDVIQNGHNGLLIKKNTRKEWFNAIRDMIENPNQRRIMALNAYDYCYQKYSVQENKGQYNIYEQIKEGKDVSV